jgi:hypothetical protein
MTEHILYNRNHPNEAELYQLLNDGHALLSETATSEPRLGSELSLHISRLAAGRQRLSVTQAAAVYDPRSDREGNPAYVIAPDVDELMRHIEDEFRRLAELMAEPTSYAAMAQRFHDMLQRLRASRWRPTMTTR